MNFTVARSQSVSTIDRVISEATFHHSIREAVLASAAARMTVAGMSSTESYTASPSWKERLLLSVLPFLLIVLLALRTVFHFAMSGFEAVAVVAAIAGIISVLQAAVALVRSLPPDIRSKLCCGSGVKPLSWSKAGRLESSILKGEGELQLL
jgi:hypothetical protein